MKILSRLAAFAALVCCATPAFAHYYYLYVNDVTQQHSEWCWAASSQDVLAYYDINTTQCNIVNWAFGINDACGNSTFDWNSQANSPNALYGQSGSVADVLASSGVSNQAYVGALSWNTIVSDINAQHPFVIRFGWYGGGGHILVGYGWWNDNGTDYVGYMNPWPGEGYTWSTYAWVKYAPYDHTWTHSLRTW